MTTSGVRCSPVGVGEALGVVLGLGVSVVEGVDVACGAAFETEAFAIAVLDKTTPPTAMTAAAVSRNMVDTTDAPDVATGRA